MYLYQPIFKTLVIRIDSQISRNYKIRLTINSITLEFIKKLVFTITCDNGNLTRVLFLKIWRRRVLTVGFLLSSESPFFYLCSLFFIATELPPLNVKLSNHLIQHR